MPFVVTARWSNQRLDDDFADGEAATCHCQYALLRQHCSPFPGFVTNSSTAFPFRSAAILFMPDMALEEGGSPDGESLRDARYEMRKSVVALVLQQLDTLPLFIFSYNKTWPRSQLMTFAGSLQHTLMTPMKYTRYIACANGEKDARSELELFCKQGLESIISTGVVNGASDEEKEMILRRTRIFYFQRQTKGITISEDDAKVAEELYSKSNSSGNAASTSSYQDASAVEEPRQLSFAELKELIEKGETDHIPNNKQIPDKLNDSAPSESIAPQKKKPWEMATASTGESVHV
ncbi:hypothetical protein EW146_g7488 [Bondarzewia mesenterica]|uniref:Peroxisomal membrane protein PEX14-like KPWE domain-containing protein n=1 Tax=Bondarzewia mesenterica TaxID=1095465 RepID=A0A4S4LKM0_9AGAM|nr:hypothetical protein EW146_g7488 [Bondarzewia mesenterica]